MRAALIKSDVVVAVIGGVRYDNSKGWVIDGGTSDGRSWAPPQEYGPVEVVEAGAAQLGWVRAGGALIAPGLSLEAALAEVDLISSSRLAAGATHRGVSFPLDTDSRVDWLGLLVMAQFLPLPIKVVGINGSLDLTSVAEIQAAAGDLALYRLAVQRRSATTREALAAATDDQARAAIVAAYREQA